MNISLVLAHPDPRSFNHAIAGAAAQQLQANGHRVCFHDLYAERFDPVLPAAEISSNAALPEEVAQHCREISTADGIVIVHPNWWGQPPAILKGWVDRVLRPGVAYNFLEGDSGEGVPVGLLKARAVLVFNTANTPPERERNVFGDPLQLLWKNCIFDFCGNPAFCREMFTVIVTSSADERERWLKKVAEAVDSYFPEAMLAAKP